MNVEKLNPAALIPGLDHHTVGDFWSWAYSDILMNTNRGVFAEFLVAVALGITDVPRIEWNEFDLRFLGQGIEVKSAAYCQSWQQSAPSRIQFDIAKRRSWSAETNTLGTDIHRAASCYVFCIFEERNPEIAHRTVRNIEAWRFYVLATSEIDRRFGNQQSLGLTTLRKVATPVAWQQLRPAIEAALATSNINAEDSAGDP